MASATVTEAGEIVIDDPARPITRLIVVDHDLSLYRYSVNDLASYYEDDKETFDEIIQAIQEQGFYKRYDDEAGVSVFAVDQYSAFEEQISTYSL